MRQDQYERLQDLEEKLTDVLLAESDPDRWPGRGIEASAMDKSTRGDRYWCKKNAVATLSLIQRVGNLIGVIQVRGSGTTPANPPAGEPPAAEDGEETPDQREADLDAEVLAYEKEAAELLRGMKDGAKKAAFDKKAHGRKAD